MAVTDVPPEVGAGPGERTTSRGARLVRLVVAAVAAALLAASCDGGTDPGGGPASPGTTTTAAGATTTTTAPGPDAGFVVFGDFGGGPRQDDVAAAMERWAQDHRVDALVTTGDNVYDFGEPSEFEAQLDEPYAELRRDRPMWVTLGNHDVVRGHGDEQLDHLGLPPLPYARELPGIELLFLDGNRPGDAEQARWLAERLSAPGPALRVAVMHQPAYSCGLHGSTETVQRAWVSLFEEHRVAAVFAGHDHLYQRFTSDGGVTYVVTGGGGRSLYRFRLPCEVGATLESYAEEFHFVGGEVEGSTLRLTAVAVDGTVIDEAVVTR